MIVITAIQRGQVSIYTYNRDSICVKVNNNFIKILRGYTICYLNKTKRHFF